MHTAIAKVTLTPYEEKLIRKVLTEQLECLTAILNDTCGRDTLLYRLQNNLDSSAWEKELNKQIRIFDEALKDPGLIFKLDEDNLGIFKTLLTLNLPKTPDLRQAYYSIWYKLTLLQNFEVYYYPN